MVRLRESRLILFLIIDPSVPENLLILTLESGEVVIELNDDFAPDHTAQIRQLAADHFYDGKAFYRVIDGFVAQGGIGEGEEVVKTYPLLKNENDRAISDDAFTSAWQSRSVCCRRGSYGRVCSRA